MNLVELVELGVIRLISCNGGMKDEIREMSLTGYVTYYLRVNTDIYLPIIPFFSVSNRPLIRAFEIGDPI